MHKIAKVNSARKKQWNLSGGLRTKTTIKVTLSLSKLPSDGPWSSRKKEFCPSSRNYKILPYFYIFNEHYMTYQPDPPDTSKEKKGKFSRVKKHHFHYELLSRDLFGDYDKPKPRTWYQAKKMCVTSLGYLPSFVSENDTVELVEFLRRVSFTALVTHIFIGTCLDVSCFESQISLVFKHCQTAWELWPK